MISLAYRMLKKQKRRTLLICCTAAISIFFILAINAAYHSYSRMQLENAYTYGGRWDIRMIVTDPDMLRELSINKDISYSGILDNTYSARLNKIAEEIKTGTSAYYIDHYYLSLLGCPRNSYSLLQYQLLEGKWPESPDEIVLPSDFDYNGNSIKDGTIKVGSSIELEVGTRIQETGMITQELNVREPEMFKPEAVRTFHVSGIMDYSNHTTGIYVSYAVTASDGNFQKVAAAYYRSKDLSFQGLRKTVKEFELAYPNTEFNTNYFVEKALYVIEESDFMKSVKYGMYIFEMLIILTGLSIVCILTFQSVRENTGNMKLMRVLGGERRHIFIIYGSQGLMTGAAGCILGSLIYLLFVISVKLLLPYLMYTNMDDIKLTLPGWVLPGTITSILIIIPVIIIFHASREFSKLRKKSNKYNINNTKQKQNRKTVKWEELNLFSLAKSNIKHAPVRNLILTFVLVIAMSAISMGVPFCMAVYQQSIRALDIAYKSDYYVLENGISYALDLLWDEIPSINSYVKRFTSNLKVAIPEERITADAKRCMDMVQTPVEDHVYYVSTAFMSVNEGFYKRLSAQNPSLPSYEDFVRSGNCYIVNKVLLPSGDIVPITDYKVNDILYASTYEDNPAAFSLTIGGILESGVGELFEGNADLYVYIPEDVYLKYIKVNTHTMYYVDAKKGETKILGELLQAAQQKYQFYLQDNVTENEAAKDAGMIQLVVAASSIVALLAMCSICISIIMKLDMIYRTREFAVYRALGVNRRQAFSLHLYEHFIPLCYATAGAFIINTIMRLIIMAGVFQAYKISGFIIITSAVITYMAFLGFAALNCLGITKQHYKKSITACLTEDYRNE